MSLATKYRPKEFEEVVCQDEVTCILKKQIETKNISNCYLFYGPSGTGKTTLARIFANKLNNNAGTPIEIDGASNNGVDNVRNIIEGAKTRSLDSEYKVYIIDECVTGDTEILTNEGFKRIDKLSKTELVAQYDKGVISFVSPSEYIERDYTGTMYNLAINGEEKFKMSPHHVQPLFRNGSFNEYYVEDLAEENLRRASFVASGRLDDCSNIIGLSKEEELYIYLYSLKKQISTSLPNTLEIKMKFSHQKNKLMKLLQDLNIHYTYEDKENNYIVRFTSDFSVSKTLNDYINFNHLITKVDMSQIKEIIYTLIKGQNNSSLINDYITSSESDLTYLQGLGALGGFTTEVTKKEGVYHISFIDSYIYRDMMTGRTTIQLTPFAYSGKIYCVVVPSHNIIIRRNNMVIITGNCHSITTQGWQAFLKCLEESPKYTIFIFCTTDVQKIPTTILNRLMKFSLSKIPQDKIQQRLLEICQKEGCTNYQSSVEYISKLSEGGMRDGINFLEKCMSFSKDFNLNTTLSILGCFSYDTMFSLINYIIDGDIENIIMFVEDLYNKGYDLRQFINLFLDFCLDILKYAMFKNINITKIPSSYMELLQYTVGPDINTENKKQVYSYFLNIVDGILSIKDEIKYDSSIKNTIIVMLTKLARE